MLTVLLTSPRVAPGLLSWDAWSAMRGASRVLAGSGSAGSGSGGHPQVAALVSSGVTVEVVDTPASDVEGLAALLSSAAASGPVVWLAWPGEAADPALLEALSVPFSVLNGSPDLPGAHLLDLVAITDRLRVSCPWDREQTHTSLLRYLIEEAYEAAETIEDGDLGALREEIGDVLFQVFFHARVASERAAVDDGFTIDDVADTLAAKLIRRHPHVFGEVEARTAQEVLKNWDVIKRDEPGREPGLFGEVPENLPSLLHARKLQRRVASSGFDPADVEGSLHALHHELDELDRAESADDRFHELGDVLFAAVNVARKLKLDPELALRAASGRFRARVSAAGELAASEGGSWDDLPPEQQLTYYARARFNQGDGRHT